MSEDLAQQGAGQSVVSRPAGNNVNLPPTAALLQAEIHRLTEALDRNRREFMSMKQAIQRGIQPHELSDQIIRCEFDTGQALKGFEK